MKKYSPEDAIMGMQVCDSRTGKSLNKIYQLLTDSKEDYLKEIFCGIVRNNLIHNNFSKVNIN